ncbi:gliding motility-associated C-terminal domain-containing protein [uncultured Hymenobacter sp.]|uniref:T9SS type B sorting domain-containing protein n=1 Tax=uncultured Hymenobacter sp. TaxID=170016 RepID=UPI0035CC1E81
MPPFASFSTRLRRYCYRLRRTVGGYWGFLALLLSPHSAAWAQAANTHWYFGEGTGLSFQTGRPQAVGLSRTSVNETCATIADAQGTLLFYTNGQSVWDRTHTALPAACAPCGTGLGGSVHASALFVRHPAGDGRYYVFTLDRPPPPTGPVYRGLQYSLLDVRLRNGLGNAVPATQNVPLQPAGPGSVLAEKLAGVQHANRRDVWVVVHGYRTNVFYSYLVTAAGVSATPVVSAVGSIHTDFGGPMKFAPNGRLLAVNQQIVGVELLAFDPATGQVSSPQALPAGSAWNNGVAFSPDNSKLYLHRLTTIAQIRQYDLSAGSWAAILASAVDLPLRSEPFINYTGGLELGPDGKIYVSQSYKSRFVGVIEHPNQSGVGCRFVESAVSLGGRGGNIGLQNIVQELPAPTLALTATPACVGAPTHFAALLPPDSLASIHWQFGDPGSGAADSAAGGAPTHTYNQAGLYSVTLRVRLSDGTRLLARRSLTISPPPAVAFVQPLRTLCSGTTATLRLTPQPAGTHYRWSDGSTQATLVVQAAGAYWVDVTDTLGCTARAQLEVRPVACLIPNLITPNGDTRNETFVLQGLEAAEWQCRLFNRWGRQIFQADSYANDWRAAEQPAGVYYYQLTNSRTGQRLTGTLEVMR